MYNDDVQSLMGYEFEQEQEKAYRTYEEREADRLEKIQNGPKVPVTPLQLQDLIMLESIFSGRTYNSVMIS